MNDDSSFRYAGWFTLDLRLLLTLLTFSAAVAVLIVALRFRGRRWDQYVSGFFAIFCLSLLASLLLTNFLAAYPAIRVETFFPAP